MNHVILCGGGLDTAATLAWLSKVWTFEATVHDTPTNDFDESRYLQWNIHHNGFLPGDQLLLLFVDYGQVSSAMEYDAVWNLSRVMFGSTIMPTHVQRIHTRDVKILNPDGGMLFGTAGSTSSKLRARNLALAMAAAAHMKGDIGHLYFCMTAELDIEMPSDTSPHFIQSLNSTFIMSELAASVTSPLINMDKDVALRMARAWYPDLFDLAWSCWTPNAQGKACGVCRHCVRFEKFRGEC